jgi:23S rRNA pseudouridine2605 synthase
VRVRGSVSDATVKRLASGVELEEGKTAPCQICIETKDARQTTLRVILHEGKKRQIRRIFEKSGHRVLELERLNYGPLALGDLRPGQKRELSQKEVRALFEATGLHA